ncbi:MAG: esterase-like activity of phytase family protein [Pseudomonadota bacterium]
MRPARQRRPLVLHALSVALLLLAVLGLPRAHHLTAAELALQAQPVALDPVHPAVAQVGALDYVAGFSLMPAPSLMPQAPSAPFGGLSDMHLAADGTALLAVSDIGWWWRLALVRDPQGRLSGVGAAEAAPLLDERGRAVGAKKKEADAEALTRLADGQWLVGLERHHRVWAYDGGADGTAAPPGPASLYPAPAAIADLPENNGIEAMAALPDGRLLLLAEGRENQTQGSAGWVGRPGAWKRLTLARTGRFRPTSLALLPSGDLLLVERSFTKAEGPAVRLSRLAASSIGPGARLVPEPIAEWRLPLTVDNFEAVAAEPAPGGGTYIFLVSDDNQNPLQRTLLLQFRWAGE